MKRRAGKIKPTVLLQPDGSGWLLVFAPCEPGACKAAPCTPACCKPALTPCCLSKPNKGREEPTAALRNEVAELRECCAEQARQLRALQTAVDMLVLEAHASSYEVQRYRWGSLVTFYTTCSWCPEASGPSTPEWRPFHAWYCVEELFSQSAPPVCYRASPAITPDSWMPPFLTPLSSSSSSQAFDFSDLRIEFE